MADFESVGLEVGVETRSSMADVVQKAERYRCGPRVDHCMGRNRVIILISPLLAIDATSGPDTPRSQKQIQVEGRGLPTSRRSQD